MGHAEHFLSRLSRLDADQEDFALALYRDPPLVRAVIKEAKVPEGADHIALALTSDASPPHVLVTRDGAFVTCLGEGMSVHDAAVVPHLRFLELRHNVVSLRELWERARDVARDRGRTSRLATRIYEAGSGLTREEMESAVAIAPLWRRDLFTTVIDMSAHLAALRKELLAWKALERQARSTRGEEKLRSLWRLTWAVSHLSLLLSASDPRRSVPAEGLAKLLVPSFYDAMQRGFFPAALRLTWALGRAGAPAAEKLLQFGSFENGALMTIFSGMGLAAMSGAQPQFRDDALGWLQRSRTSLAGDSFCLCLRDELEGALLDPGAKDESVLASGRSIIWDMGRELKQLPWSSKDHIPEADVRALFAHTEIDMLGSDLRGLGLLIRSLPWLGRAQPEDFYFSVTHHRASDQFRIESGLEILEGMRHLEVTQEPVRVERAPGRNEPCPCGSGKKFKKCCAAA